MAALVDPIEETVMLESTGGIVSTLETVTPTPAEVAVLPAASRATAVKLWGPLDAKVVFQEIAKGAEVSSAPRLPPSSLNWTPTTPTLSEALAETVMVPETVNPGAGAVRATVGGVVSGTALETVTLTGVEVAVL